MDENAAREDRRKRRAAIMTVRKLGLHDEDPIDDIVRGADAFYLTTEITALAFEIAGKPAKRIPRAEWPIVRRNLHVA